MDCKVDIKERILHFKRPAGTSRGIYLERKVWYLHLTSDTCPERVGIGECAPLPNLSCDDRPDYAEVLRAETEAFIHSGGHIDIGRLKAYPSILFGLETALRHLQRGNYALFDTPFSRGECGIPINGLIWMGDYEYMYRQIEAKMAAGFRCIKLKIGAIDFDSELELLRHIRRHFSREEVELRVDANGAFTPQNALHRLERLSTLDLHSIEQPIRAGQWNEMARICRETPLPVALDEELIGCNDPTLKQQLLEHIRPQYIILKPSLHGAMTGCEEWIRLAEERNIGWWITSALESNIGLNAIAQWCATLDNPRPQGLGTGALFTDNVAMPLEVRGDCLWYGR